MRQKAPAPGGSHRTNPSRAEKRPFRPGRGLLSALWAQFGPKRPFPAGKGLLSALWAQFGPKGPFPAGKGAILGFVGPIRAGKPLSGRGGGTIPVSPQLEWGGGGGRGGGGGLALFLVANGGHRYCRATGREKRSGQLSHALGFEDEPEREPKAALTAHILGGEGQNDADSRHMPAIRSTF